MAAPHVIELTKVGYNSKTHVVSNYSLSDVGIDVYDDTSQAPFNSQLNPIAGAKYINTSFTTELNPSGSAAGAKTSPHGVLLKGCWFKETVATTVSTTYTLTGAVADYTAVTIGKAIGAGYLQTCTTGLGSVTFRLSPQSPVMCDWSFGGTYATPTEATIADALDDGGAAPICIGTCTVNADTLVLSSMTITVSNAIKHPRYDMAATYGVSAPVMTGQICTMSLNVELPAFATENYITDLLAATVIPISVAIGTGAGYVTTITAKGYLTGPPALTNAGGILGATLNLRMGWATGEPLSIAFT